VLWQIHKKSQLPQPFVMGGNSEDSEEQQKDISEIKSSNIRKILGFRLNTGLKTCEIGDG
jgi:hypothetical protein